MISPPGIDLPYYLQKIIDFFTDNYPFIIDVTKSLLGLFIGMCIILSILLLIGIVIAVEEIKRIRNKEDEKYNTNTVPAYTDEKIDPKLGAIWSKILQHMESNNQNDWKQAIIEADIMLEGLLVKLGYRGEGIGERLRRVEKGDFKTLEQAGEAHGIRNRIAHDGSGFELNKIEAQRVINLYRSVFEEFYHIS